MKALSPALLKRFIKLAAQELEGDWILVGGTVLPLLDREYRATTDIDLVPIGNATNDQNLRLMEICEKLELPVETVNSAAALFVRRVPEFKKHLVPIAQGKTSQIFRPDTYLFIQLKIGRLSESDLSDCLEMLRTQKDELKAADRKELQRKIKELLSRATGEQAQRLTALEHAL